MVRIGIFARTFSRPNLEDLLDTVAGYGLTHVHFNLKAAGIGSLPDEIDNALCGRIRGAFSSRGMVMTSVSGTFNAIDPDPRKRDRDTQRACVLIENCSSIGTSMVSLCTGTRDPHDMWRRHPENDRPDAWRDLLATLSRLLPVAERCGVTLGIEPEINNVIDSAAKARRLLNELRSPCLKIIMDGANLFDPSGNIGGPASMHSVLAEAFQLLAPDMVLVHAKDLADPEEPSCQAVGRGRLNWTTYCRLLVEHDYRGPIILHNLAESEVAESLSFLGNHLAKAGWEG